MAQRRVGRRSLLAWLAAAPFAASGAFQDRAAASVTVRDLEIFRVKVNRRGDWVLVRLQTTAGVSGIGDASHGTQDQATIGFLKQFIELLKGRSVFEIERLRQAVEPQIAASRGTSAPVAWSALEQCLWDIQGKLAGRPVCDSELREHQQVGGRPHAGRLCPDGRSGRQGWL